MTARRLPDLSSFAPLLQYLRIWLGGSVDRTRTMRCCLLTRYVYQPILGAWHSDDVHPPADDLAGTTANTELDNNTGWKSGCAAVFEMHPIKTTCSLEAVLDLGSSPRTQRQRPGPPGAVAASTRPDVALSALLVVRDRVHELDGLITMSGLLE